MAGLFRKVLLAALDRIAPDPAPNAGSALALRSDAQFAPVAESRSRFLPTVRPSQTLYAPPPAVEHAPPRRRRRIVIVEETTWRE